MKKYAAVKSIAFLLLVLPVCFSACIKDHCKKQHTYSYYVPVYKTKEDVRNNIKSNAARPIEKPGKIYVLGNTIFLNEIDKGIHIIDNSNPSNPRNTGFIDIPGNLDIAVKGSTLYADFYTDLVTLDISNPADVKVKKIVENLFPYRYYASFVADQSRIIVEWQRKDTTVTENCDDEPSIAQLFDSGGIFFASTASSPGNSTSPVGTGGSMARFTIMNSRLYTVSDISLDVFNITAPQEPQHVSRVQIGWGIETIYPFKNKLFIGSQTGMFIYDVSNPNQPTAAGQFNHIRSCDPVVADDNYAYVTLRSGNFCGGFSNQMDIVNINNISAPTLAKTYTMTNPHGLSLDLHTLFVCDGTAGVKIYNSADVMNIQPIKTITGLDAYDVITLNKVALIVAKDGLYQYDYSSLSDIRLLSKISITPN